MSAFEYPILVDKRLLIVDDETVVLMQLRQLACRAGLKVVGAAFSGRQAVEVALRERPDILLLDFGFDGMDGLEAARQVLSVYTPCIVLLTRYPEESIREQAQAVGIHGFIGKPISHECLLLQLAHCYEAYLAAQVG